jgi:hypothetical protein
MGLHESAFGVEGQSWVAPDTRPIPRAPLWSLVAIAHVDGSPRSSGMEYCLMHSLACTQVTEVGHTLFAARALLVLVMLKVAVLFVRRITLLC